MDAGGQVIGSSGRSELGQQVQVGRQGEGSIGASTRYGEVGREAGGGRGAGHVCSRHESLTLTRWMKNIPGNGRTELRGGRKG